MTTVEEILQLGEPDPEQTAILEKIGPLPKLDWSDMEGIRGRDRQRYSAELAKHGETTAQATERDVQIPRRDGTTTIRARLLAPTTPSPGGSPLVVLFFGGGFVMGFPELMTFFARTVVAAYGATVLLPSYRLAPEDPFPAAPHDAWDAVEWAATQHAADTLGADLSRGFVVGGISAGANLSLVVATQWVEEARSPPITGLWLSVPMVYAVKQHVPEPFRDRYLSMQQNAYSPILTIDTLREMRTRYAPQVGSPLYSPGLRTAAVSKMPPIYFQVCGMDPMRDDALIYNAILEDAGRDTLLHIYPGLVHAAWEFFPSIHLAKQAHIDFRVGMGWLLGQEPRDDPPTDGGSEV